MKKIIVLVIVVIVIGLIWHYSKNPTDPSANLPTTAEVVPIGEGMIVTPPAPVTTTPAGAVKEFTVIGSNYAFTPNKMEVKVGDTVRINFKNADGFHDLKIDEFQVATKQLKAGESETIEFVANKFGAFEYYCTVGNHRAMGMKGTLNVTSN